MGFLTQIDSAEAPFPHSTPETAEFLGEDLLQVRAWAGWAGLGGRPVQAVRIEPGRQGQQSRAWLCHSLLARGGPGGKRKVILGETAEQ